MPAEESLPSCLECGTCCFSSLPTYVRVTGDDHERLGEDAESLTHFVGNRCYLRTVEGRCAALRVDGKAGTFVCTVYERRPSTCRQLERGSPECLGELATKGERPRLALLSARRGIGTPQSPS
ncbi:MAG: YkgJ family cysteine cluster protein [Polyangiales bacterium]